MDTTKEEKTHALTEGRRDPSGVRTPPCKRTKTHPNQGKPQTNPAKDNPHPTYQGQPPNHRNPGPPRRPPYLSMQPTPIPSHVQVMSSTKNASHPPWFVKDAQHGFFRNLANLNVFQNPLPSHLSMKLSLHFCESKLPEEYIFYLNGFQDWHQRPQTSFVRYSWTESTSNLITWMAWFFECCHSY